MWNFSNGQLLTDLINPDQNKKSDRKEITTLLCVYDKDCMDDLEKKSQIISAGWDRKINIWDDEKEEEVEVNKTLPQEQQLAHKDDIMSAVYCHKNSMIYTGGHDGTIYVWNFETGYVKNTLHHLDDTCTDDEPIMKSKSVDAMLILEKRNKLLTMTAD